MREQEEVWLDELKCEFITAVAYKDGIAINGYTDKCEEVNFKSVGSILKLMNLRTEEVDRVIVFELIEEEFCRVGTYSL